MDENAHRDQKTYQRDGESIIIVVVSRYSLFLDIIFVKFYHVLPVAKWAHHEYLSAAIIPSESHYQKSYVSFIKP